MKKTLVLAAMAAPVALAGAQDNGFEAATIAHTGTLRVDAAPEHARYARITPSLRECSSSGSG